jgi:hypothetical protein
LKNIVVSFLLAIALFIAMPITSQTDVTICPTCAVNAPIIINIGPAGFGCGQLTGLYPCTGIPIAQGDVQSTLNIHPVSNVGNANVQFGLGIDNLGLAHVTSFDSTSQANTITMQFYGPDPDYIPYPNEPAPQYTGTLTLTYKTYRGYRSGRGAGYFTGWTITGGTVSIRY